MIGAAAFAGQRRPEPQGAPRPPLTSLGDMMVILVVFLLQSFAVEGQLVVPARDLQLPESTASTAAAPTMSLEVTTSGINLDGVRTAALPGPDDDLLIAPLAAALRAFAPAGAEATGGRPLTIQCDRRIDFAVLKRVLYTCDQAGRGQLSLLVLREAS